MVSYPWHRYNLSCSAAFLHLLWTGFFSMVIDVFYADETRRWWWCTKLQSRYLFWASTTTESMPLLILFCYRQHHMLNSYLVSVAKYWCSNFCSLFSKLLKYSNTFVSFRGIAHLARYGKTFWDFILTFIILLLISAETS